MEKRVLVIAPHPDDEVLGVGGTIGRLADEGAEIHVVFVTKGGPPLFQEEFVNVVRREALAVHELLGVKDTLFLSFPAAALDTVPHSDLNAELAVIIGRLRPDTLFIPFVGDIHLDHQCVFASALVASRPNGSWTPATIYAYETLSETNWNAPYLTTGFVPNSFVDISRYLEKKIEAMQQYASQLKVFPHERSVEAMRALAMLRGSTVCVQAAEAFVLIRHIV